MTKQVFYEQMYAASRSHPRPAGLLGWLYVRLRRFERHREEVVLGLLPPGKRYLDVGCGRGSLVLRAADRFDEVYGLDIAPGRLEQGHTGATLRPPGRGSVHFVAGDADASLPWEDGFFDAVSCVAVLEHLFDPYQAVGEMARVLRPGGVLLLEVPNVAWLPRRLSLLRGQLPRTSEETGWDGGHLHYFTLAAVHGLLHQSGFRVGQTTSSGIFARCRSWWPSLLSGDVVVQAFKPGSEARERAAGG